MDVSRDRINNGAKRYLALQGYEYLDEANDFIVCYDPAEEQVVFVSVLCTTAPEEADIDGKLNIFMSSSDADLRAAFEKAMTSYYLSHDDVGVDQDIRCDEMCLCIIGDSRALVRHHVNACGWR